MVQAPQGPRARYREQTRTEIKDAALRQLADGGVGALALTRIAKEMGLSGPALYRYFASRDDLLNALIRDAYDDAATAVGAAAVAGTPPKAPRQRLHVLARAYRAWALAQPHRYLLIQGTPVPGYVAPGDTLDRARAVLGPFLPVFAGAAPGASVLPVVRQTTDWARSDEAVAGWVAEYVQEAEAGQAGAGESGAGQAGIAGQALAGAVLAWAQLHGTVSLEVAGQFAGMGNDGATLLTAQINTLADAFSLE
ncbi:TetR/AcrR family transcriptional regulator [Streptomyces sp. 21So2-11]|uniref:TetR/AcrR family transcriptional regulator n=1 Tax=Streptomyces sp. 21So2-11 TaxID=3144408 RepID=UPI00321C1DB6